MRSERLGEQLRVSPLVEPGEALQLQGVEEDLAAGAQASDGQAEVVAEVVVEVAWVYQSSRQSFSRWRLF